MLPPGSLKSLQQPVLEIDNRLSLRPWTARDVSQLVTAYSDPDIQRWNLHSFDTSEAEGLITKWSNDWKNETKAYWAIANSSDGIAFGQVGLRTINLVEGVGEITYWIMPHARGTGAATLATSTLSKWAFERLGLHRLELGHSVRNGASCRVALKAGFELEGTLKSSVLHSDGWHDMHIHAQINRETS